MALTESGLDSDVEAVTSVTFSPLCENKGLHTTFPHYHVKTSLSCLCFLFQMKNEGIVAFTSYGNNF